MKKRIFFKFIVFFTVISLFYLALPSFTYAYEEDKILKMNSNGEVEEIDVKDIENKLLEKYDGQIPTHTNAYMPSKYANNEDKDINHLLRYSLTNVSNTLTSPYIQICKITSNSGERNRFFSWFEFITYS